MTDGVTVSLDELYALGRQVHVMSRRTAGRAISIGQHHSKHRGRGMDFSETRHYQAGDEIRHMEWRVTARTGKPHIKLYQEERERPVVIFCDFNPSMYFGTRVAFKSVIAAKLSATIAWSALQQGDRVGGLISSATENAEFMPRARESGLLPFLSALARYTCNYKQGANKPRPLQEALQRLRRVTKPGSIIVIISDFYTLNTECEPHLRRLCHYNEVLAYHVRDPLELKAPTPGRYPLTNGEEELILDTAVSKQREGYQNYCDKRIQTLQNTFKRLQIQMTAVTATEDLSRLVLQTFPRNVRE